DSPLLPADQIRLAVAALAEVDAVHDDALEGVHVRVPHERAMVEIVGAQRYLGHGQCPVHAPSTEQAGKAYSARSASVGSTRSARMVGTTQASVQIPSIRIA